MALFKIFKGSDSAKLTNPQATGYKVPVDGYAYYDTSTKLFYIDADYSSNNNGTISRQPINAYKADIATLANAAVYETGPNQNDPLHKINEYYGHELTFSNHTLSLMAGDGITTLGSTVGLVSKSSDGFAPQLPNENEYNKFLRQDGNWVAPGIPFAAVDSTSTATNFTATVPGITELRDGTAVLLYNGKVTSTTNYTININGLGAYGTYSNMSLGNSITPTSPTRDTTIFNINYAMLFVFCTTIHGVGSGWICYRGYDANTNTIGYQIRTNSFSLPMTSIVYRYRLLFQSADNNHWVPATNSTSTNATSSRTVCQDPINPLGAIVYYGTTSSVSAGSRPSTSYLWQQYAFNLGYSFQKSPNYSLTSWKPVYLKCELQSNGSAIIDSDDPIVQDLPSIEDGKIYILLGYAYNTTNIELVYYHPVYYYKDGLVRVWTGASIPTKTSDLTNDVGYITGMYIASYGSSTFADVLAAYQANKIVYCRASSNNDPATGNQGRMAFLAYVNGGDNPTEFEFQYYRSVATHTDAQQGDQVYVYKLNSSGWSVTTREAYTKISPSSGLSKSYSSGTLTITHDTPSGASSGIKGNANITDLEFIKTITTDAYGHVINHTTGSLPIYDGTAT